MPEREITSEVLLCDEQGNLNPDAVGWSRKPLHTCNVRGHYPRKKKWDYWCITGERFLFSATIAHIDYLSLGAIYFLEYDTSRFAEQACVKFFSRYPLMLDRVDESVCFFQRRLRLEFHRREDGVDMEVQSKRFGGKPFHASLQIRRPAEQECLNVVIPWNRRRFQFTSKQECLPASGTLTWGEEVLTFSPGSAFACLDFGRGVWPYRTAWNWASFSGHSGSDVVGLNAGAKWTDGTGMNENGILLNGRMHKISEDIEFEYDAKAFMRPWKLKTKESDAVNLEFTPFYEKAGALNLLLISADTHQLFGHFTGTLRVDDKTIVIDRQLGWAEEHRARW